MQNIFFVFFPPFCPLLVRLQLLSASIWHNCSFHLCMNGLGRNSEWVLHICCWLTLTRVFNICSVIVCLQRYSTVFNVIYAFFLLLPGPLNSQWKEISRKYCSGCLILFYPFFFAIHRVTSIFYNEFLMRIDIDWGSALLLGVNSFPSFGICIKIHRSGTFEAS